jgi:hypothetical protein
MSDYQQSSIVGTRWKRARRISIDNPLNGAPSVLFAEDEVMALGDGVTIERPASNLTAGYDPGHSFPLRDPATGEEIPRARPVRKRSSMRCSTQPTGRWRWKGMAAEAGRAHVKMLSILAWR